MVDLTCAQIVRRASGYLDGVLTDIEKRDFDAHLGGCDSCSCHVSQLRATIGVLGDRPAIAVPEELRLALVDTMVGLDDRALGERAAVEHTSYLLGLAATFDPVSPEDLVQATWLRAFDEGSGAFTRPRLTQLLVEVAAESDDAPDVGSVYDHDGSADAAVTARDPDADTAELFYPSFYTEGPDAGSWVTPPNVWPAEPRILSPEDDLATAELYDVVDEAIGQLSEQQAQILTLVDIEGESSAHVGSLLGYEPSEVGVALNVARNHVRAALDGYVTSTL
jgi:DNA-directed RNA polymerase specialized sigma24 family protein